ncbi:MAG TPA: hypothetical protein VMW78_03755 [Anaerolineae bacterium]|nr:hypothetical protein [Anaerolineae bacterium]
MGLTEKITIFSSRTIAKNASIVLATPIYLGKCGPKTKYFADLNASGGGNVAVTYQVGDTPDETFYTPANATAIHTSFKSSVGNASRDRFNASIISTVWAKFKAKEANASPVVLNMDLIISKN